MELDVILRYPYSTNIFLQERGKKFLTRETSNDSLSLEEASKNSASENETEFRGHTIAKFIAILRGYYTKREKIV